MKSSLSFDIVCSVLMLSLSSRAFTDTEIKFNFWNVLANKNYRIYGIYHMRL